MGNTPLYCAVIARHPAVVNLLAEAGADVNLASDSGVTPLMQATIQDDVEMVRTLLLRKADHKLKDKSGEPYLCML